MSKFLNFQSRTAESHTRFLAMHLPRGRVWNTKTGKTLWKLIYSLASGFMLLYNLSSNIINEFRIDTSVAWLSDWEESLGIDTDATLTLAVRRANVKAQLKKITIVLKSEWEANLSEGLGKTITVYPALSFVADTGFAFPWYFPHFFYLPYPTRIPQNRFIIIIDGATGADEVLQIQNIIKKYIPTFVYAIIIDRDFVI